MLDHKSIQQVMTVVHLMLNALQVNILYCIRFIFILMKTEAVVELVARN